MDGRRDGHVGRYKLRLLLELINLSSSYLTSGDTDVIMSTWQGILWSFGPTPVTGLYAT